MIEKLIPARPYSSVHLMLIRDDAIFFLKRQNCDDNNGLYAFPAGKVDNGETPVQALIREAKEEIDIDILPEDVKPQCLIYRTSREYKGEMIDVLEFFLRVEKWSGVPLNLEPHKASEIGFFNRKDLPESLTESVKTVLKNKDSSYIEIIADDWDNPVTLSLSHS
jgi:8-oxo-dGTP diphosphatase